jgi:hypothetical protein
MPRAADFMCKERHLGVADWLSAQHLYTTATPGFYWKAGWVGLVGCPLGPVLCSAASSRDTLPPHAPQRTQFSARYCVQCKHHTTAAGQCDASNKEHMLAC